jgi:hypothetical protein
VARENISWVSRELWRGGGITFASKVKVKLFLCLTKYHAMIILPLLNQSSRHEDIWESGRTAPSILNLGTRLK